MLHSFGLHDLEFDELPVTCYSTRGTPYARRVEVGMPRISEDTLDSTFFLYRSAEDANVGASFGGTGFVLSVPSERVEDLTYFYGVTNWHVVRDGFSVIRLNTLDGATDTLEFGPEEWEFDKDGDDLAIIQLSPDFTTHMNKPIPAALIHDKKTLHDPNQFNVGLGDDVFMLGRFVEMDYGPANLPTARFGHISASLVPMHQRGPTAGMKEGYCLDMHSRSGYSGSPVFVYRTSGTNLDYTLKHGTPDLKRSMLCLLGVLRGQFDEDLKINGDGGQVARGASGMTVVIPAWRILELLNKDKLKQERARSDAIWLERDRRKGPVEESSKPDESNPSHREDFNSLLDAAVRGKP